MIRHRVGVVGLGMAARKHALALAQLSDRADVVVWSPTARRRSDFAETYGVAACETFEAMLADPAIDLMLILTPPWTHLDLVGRCVAAGKHVLLEKPIEATLERSEAVVRLFEGSPLKLGIVFQNRIRTPHRALREMLRQGALGDPISLSVSVRWWRTPQYFAEPGRGMQDRDGGGVLLTQAIHAMDQMIDLVGAPDAVSGFGSTSALRAIDTEDSAVAAMRWTSGCIGVLDATTTSFPGGGERIEIACTLGSAVLERTRLLVSWQDGRREDIEEDAADAAVAGDFLAHRRLIEDMLDAVEGDHAPGADGPGSLAVHRLIDAVLRR